LCVSIVAEHCNILTQSDNIDMSSKNDVNDCINYVLLIDIVLPLWNVNYMQCSYL